jgi:tRNA-dihydrouridine synthase
VPATELFQVVSLHLGMMVDLYGANIAVPMFRKHLVRYLDGFLVTPEIRRHIFTIEPPDLLLSEIEKLLLQRES